MRPPRSFALHTARLRDRADVSYAYQGSAVESSLAGARFDLVRLEDVVTAVDYGTSHRATVDEGVPVVRMNNLRDDGWLLQDLKYLPADTPDVDRFRLRRGDVIVNRTNSKELVGKAGVWQLDGDWLFASYLLRLVVDPDLILPEYLAAVLNSEIGRRQIDRLSRQIAGMTNINTAELRSIRLPMPSLARQKKLTDSLMAARLARDRVVAESKAELASLADLAMEALGIGVPAPAAHKVFAVDGDLVLRSGRLDPASFDPDRIAVRTQLSRPNGGLAWAVLGEVCEIRHERTTVEDGSPYVGLGDVASATGELLKANDESSPAAGLRFEIDDVLYSRLRPVLNKVWLADRSGVCSTEFRVLRVKEPRALRPAFLSLAMRSRAILAQTTPLASGNTHPRVSDDDLGQLVLPLPPPPQQNALVKSAAARAKRAAASRDRGLRAWGGAKQAFVRSLISEKR